jgi:hypothetical protein
MSLIHLMIDHLLILSIERFCLGVSADARPQTRVLKTEDPEYSGPQ